MNTLKVEGQLCSGVNKSIRFFFYVGGQQSHKGATPDKFELVLLDYWVGLKRALLLFVTSSPRPDTVRVNSRSASISEFRLSVKKVDLVPNACQFRLHNAFRYSA